MAPIKALHRKAMDLAEQAFVEKINGNMDAFHNLSLEALAAEKEAANHLLLQFDKEPTRSVLFRSAAVLAMDCRDYITAEQLVASSLIGSPPEEIKEELKNLYETINFKRHLSIDGLSLSEDEFQMSISGDAVGYGMMESHHFLDRISSLEKIVTRTSARKIGKPFQNRGRKSKELEKYTLYMSVPRAASFAVTLKVGGVYNQTSLSGMSSGKVIIDEILQCIKLFQQENIESLRERIDDNSYFENFISLARQIMPDGEDIKMVGFTRGKNDKESDDEITLTRTKNDLIENTESTLRIVEPSYQLLKDEKVSISGFLDFADSQKPNKKIKLTDESGESHTFIVPESMMDDIVRPLWGEQVTATGHRRAQSNYLEYIDKA